MDRRELHKHLIEKGVSPASFDVLGSDRDPIPGDRYLLRHIPSHIAGRPDSWVTYYAERGGWHGVKRFVSEDDACRSFLAMILNDPTTQSPATQNSWDC